jgi:hypothetical protein
MCQYDSCTATARSVSSSIPQRQPAQENISVVVPVNWPCTSRKFALLAGQCDAVAHGPRV